MNHCALHGVTASALVLRRRVEVEAGLAVVVLCLAGSLASAPPAADVPERHRVALAEIRTVLAPAVAATRDAERGRAGGRLCAGEPVGAARAGPTRRGPSSVTTLLGLFVLAMGLLAMLERTGRVPWARHWPLLIVGLTGFVAWSMDPEGWQTGAVSVWRQFLAPRWCNTGCCWR